MKSINQDRLVAAHDKVGEFAQRLMRREQDVLMAGFAFAVKSKVYDQLGGNPPEKELNVARLTCDYHEVFTREDYLEMMDSLERKRSRVQALREWLDSIQLAHDVSGLRKGVVEINGGSLEVWEPADQQMTFTPSDIELLKQDRPRVVQFWIDHALMGGFDLYKYRSVEGDWCPTTVDFCQLISREFDRAYIWQNVFWFDAGEWARANIGDPLKSTCTPSEGLSKHHEIHLEIGTGGSWENPDDSISLCACNRIPIL